MALAMIMFGLVLASMPALAHRSGRRLRSAEWARLSAAGLVAGAVVVEVGLVLVATPTILRAAGVEAFAAACGRVLAPLVPFGDTGGWVAGLLVSLTMLAGLRELSRARRAAAVAWIEPLVGEHRVDLDGVDFVVLTVDSPLAYSVSAPTPQIVVSSGFASRLGAEELEVVVAHERAHLRLGHHRILCAVAVARAAMAWWPLAARSHRVVRTAHERWADDAATGNDDDRRQRLARVLERVAFDPLPVAAVGLSPAHTIAERIAALDQPSSNGGAHAAPVLRIALYIPGGIAGVATLGAFSVWATQAQFVMALAGRCPLQA